MFTTCINYQCIHIKTKIFKWKRGRGGGERAPGGERASERATQSDSERGRKSRRKGTEACTKACSNFCLCFSHTALTFLTRVSMLLEKKGGSRAAIWYRMQPSAHTSAFSPYGWFCTISGLQRSNTALVKMASRTCSKKIQHPPPQVWDCASYHLTFSNIPQNPVFLTKFCSKEIALCSASGPLKDTSLHNLWTWHTVPNQSFGLFSVLQNCSSSFTYKTFLFRTFSKTVSRKHKMWINSKWIMVKTSRCTDFTEHNHMWKKQMQMTPHWSLIYSKEWE